MSKAVLNSSAIIALSNLGYLNKLQEIFKRILVAKAVYEEICIAGQGLIGEHELQETVKANLIEVKEAKNRLLVNALVDPLDLARADVITL